VTSLSSGAIDITSINGATFNNEQTNMNWLQQVNMLQMIQKLVVKTKCLPPALRLRIEVWFLGEGAHTSSMALNFALVVPAYGMDSSPVVPDSGCSRRPRPADLDVDIALLDFEEKLQERVGFELRQPVDATSHVAINEERFPSGDGMGTNETFIIYYCHRIKALVIQRRLLRSTNIGSTRNVLSPITKAWNRRLM